MRPIGFWKNAFARRAALVATLALWWIIIGALVFACAIAMALLYAALAPFEALRDLLRIVRKHTGGLHDAARRVWAGS